MPIAKITSQGLAVIALLVSALWGCILAENAFNRSAQQMMLASQHELWMLRHGLRKVNAPARSPAHVLPHRIATS
jgi:hypothetical protein